MVAHLSQRIEQPLLQFTLAVRQLALLLCQLGLGCSERALLGGSFILCLPQLRRSFLAALLASL